MLLALATVLPELFSGSTPIGGFLNPGLLLFLLLGYGVSVLLIRELAVRRHCGLLGLLALGLAYSVFNEGLLAKTLIIDSHLPVALYDHYGYWLGISFPWAAAIGTWHAFASVIFPILLTHHLFPKAKDRPWLSPKFAVSLAVVIMLLACAVFLSPSEKGVKGTPGQLLLLWGIILIGLLLGGLSKREVHGGAANSIAGPLLLGFSILVPFWSMGWLASARVPVMVFFIVLVAFILFYAWILRRRHWLTLPNFLLFGVGWYAHNALQAVVFIGILSKSPLRAIVTAAVDALILLVLVSQIGRRARSI